MIFLGVPKRTSNAEVHGDLGRMSCISKQRLEVIRFYYELRIIEQCHILHKINVWSLRKRRPSDSEVTFQPLLDAGVSKKLFMDEVRCKIRICDEQYLVFKTLG